ncbi:MAG: hypothetical protein AB7O67_02515 [Vicinamibacterales bacterium]
MKLVSILTCLAVAALAAGCGTDTPTSPDDTTDSVADPSITETFAGTLTPGGSAFYAFTVGENGTVNVTLTSIGGTAAVPSTTWVGMGLGTPSGEDCATATSINTQAGGEDVAQLTGTYAEGVYCVRVADIGNLGAAAPFTVVIAHP